VRGMRRESSVDGREAGGGFLSVATYVSVVVCIDGTRALFISAGPSHCGCFVQFGCSKSMQGCV
jgi:hypothetical protein